MFNHAKRQAPCIIFIDELDAIGTTCGNNPNGGNDEREQTLNQLLTEMDGFDGNDGVIVVAATNRPEILDPALRRPGRFDRQVLVDRPDRSGRVEIWWQQGFENLYCSARLRCLRLYPANARSRSLFAAGR